MNVDEGIHVNMKYTYAVALHKFDLRIRYMTSEGRPSRRMEDADVGCNSFILIEKHWD